MQVRTLNIFPAPFRTEKERMLLRASPVTSGTSFMSAMIAPNTPKKRVAARHLGSRSKDRKLRLGPPNAALEA